MRHNMKQVGIVAEKKNAEYRLKHMKGISARYEGIGRAGEWRLHVNTTRHHARARSGENNEAPNRGGIYACFGAITQRHRQARMSPVRQKRNIYSSPHVAHGVMRYRRHRGEPSQKKCH